MVGSLGGIEAGERDGRERRDNLPKRLEQRRPVVVTEPVNIAWRRRG